MTLIELMLLYPIGSWVNHTGSQYLSESSYQVVGYGDATPHLLVKDGRTGREVRFGSFKHISPTDAPITGEPTHV